MDEDTERKQREENWRKLRKGEEKWEKKGDGAKTIIEGGKRGELRERTTRRRKSKRRRRQRFYRRRCRREWN